MAMYKGFSTYNRFKKFRITDFELAKQDLLNHFNIRKGSKLMNPEFGTVIWDLLFDPLTDALKSQVIADVKKIVSYDPRIAVNSVILTEYDHGLQIEIGLVFVTTNKAETMYLQFDKNGKLSTQPIQ